ncbi:MAG: hypothetical protein IJ333_10650 [Clostridia bacterium]|nr:hypothetical protein [Clostridia bacterium]
MLNKIVQAIRWIGKHWAISLACFLVIAVSVTTAICWNAFGKEQVETVSIYVTVKGLGEGKDMETRELVVPDSSTIADIFSMENPEIYEDFGKPLVYNNVFHSFLGVKANSSKKFYVTIDGANENNLTQAYIRIGSVVVIEYR